MKRRDFVKRAAAGTGSFAAMSMYEMLEAGDAQAVSTSGAMGVEEGMYHLDIGKEKNVMPELRPELKNNPRSVFLIETHVDARKDETGHFTEAVPQLVEEGASVAERLLVKGTKKGGSTCFKPNFTHVYSWDYNRTNAVYSSPDFIAGMVNHLRTIDNTNLIACEGPTASRVHRLGGVYDGFDPVELRMVEAGYERFEHFRKKDLNWKKTKDSVVWKQIPYVRPFGDEDNFLINVAAMKCHLTGLTTLTVKNLQGCVPRGYGQFCTPWDSLESGAVRAGIPFKRDFHKNWQQDVEASFLKHRAAGFKRWDHTGGYKRYEAKGGWDAYKKAKKDGREALRDFMSDVGQLMQHELWVHRGLENAEALKPDLNVVCGIFAIDGEELHRDRIGTSQLTNIVVAGVSPYEVDAVGSYIMGHDPRELYYTRIAKERGFGECDVNKIDINLIRDNGEIVPVKNLSEIKRHKIGLNWARKEDPNERLFW
jgi:uncharacterized protein (DUF362 family)